MKKILLVLIITVVLIALILVGGLLYLKSNPNNFPCWPPFCMPGRPMPDQAASWKTYKNDEYGFELKYPSILSVSENQGVISTFSNLTAINNKGSNISFTIASADTNVLNEAKDKVKVNIGGYEAEKFVRLGYPTTTDIPKIIYFVPQKNIEIIYNLGNADFHKIYEKEWNLILSNFKFTK